MTDTGINTPAPPAADVDLVALRIGQTIGRYEIVSILGQGGFGITYRARDSQLGRDVAIKEYLPSALAIRQQDSTVLPRSTKVADDFTWGRERFVAEGRTLATLQRASAIVRVFDFLEANGTAYIVMELVPGETLEARLRERGTLGRGEVERILWPLLEGLEQVHAAGFLHRDIKPANILLDGEGNPTLIDFGASRAAMAGRTVAMTAIFTPGYAAAEQFTSAKQGPWTDIYGVAATLYHAITGGAPPSAFDRMLEDGLKTLSGIRPEGFPPTLLAGLDAGLAVRANERPQSIAAWRPLLAGDGGATMVIRPPATDATQILRTPAAPSDVAAAPAVRGRRPLSLGLAVAAVVLLAAAGGGYWYATQPDPAAIEAAHRQQEAAEAAAAKQKAEQEAAQRRQIEEETRRKVEAELAAKRKAEEETRKAAIAAEQVLHFTPLDRQHIQVALTALGFPTGGTDGLFKPPTRQMIADWQKSRNEPATSFLTGAQHQALLREAAPAIARFDDEQKKADDARKAEQEGRRKADDEARRTAESHETALRLTPADRQRAQVALAALGFPTGATDGVFSARTREQIGAWQKTHGDVATGFLTGAQNQALLREAVPAVSRYDEERKAEEQRSRAAAAPPPPSQPVPQAPPAPLPAQPLGPRTGADGAWQGTYHCTPSRGGGDFTIRFQVEIAGGAGTWTRPGSGPGTVGNQSLSLKVTGNNVHVARVFSPFNQVGVFTTATMPAHFDGNTITGSAPEANSGGRRCDINLSRLR